MKSEPSEFSFEDLYKSPEKTAYWDGIRNYQARNFMRDEMRIGDLAFFYHSNCAEPGIVGIAKVVREGYPDFTAFDRKDKHYDPKSKEENPTWFMVDMRYEKKLKKPVLLADIKNSLKLKNMKLVQKGNRLSIMPVSKKEWGDILCMAK